MSFDPVDVRGNPKLHAKDWVAAWEWEDGTAGAEHVVHTTAETRPWRLYAAPDPDTDGVLESIMAPLLVGRARKKRPKSKFVHGGRRKRATRLPNPGQNTRQRPVARSVRVMEPANIHPDF